MARVWYKRTNFDGSEQRKKPDWIKRAAGLLSILGWFCIVFGASMFSDAMPVTEGFSKQFFGVVTKSWNRQALFFSLALFCLAGAMGIFGLFCNLKRLKRETDRIYKSIVVLCLVSIACTAYVLHGFREVIF